MDGGHTEPENKKLIFYKPLNFYRRKLHVICPATKGVRKNYGGTFSLGVCRGTLVNHHKYGRCLVGGNSNNRISLHCVKTNKRFCQNAKKDDLKILTNFKNNILTI